MSFGCRRVKELLLATGIQKSWCQRGPWKSVALQTSLLSSSNWLEQAAGQWSFLRGEIAELLSSLLTAGSRTGMDRFLFHTPAKIQGDQKKDLLSYISAMPLALYSIPHPHGRSWEFGHNQVSSGAILLQEVAGELGGMGFWLLGKHEPRCR